MEITEVKVFPVREEKLKAFVSVVFDHCFMVNDIKIIRGRQGLFISMPSRKKKNGEFKDVAHPLNNETRQRIEGLVLAEYERALDEQGERIEERDGVARDGAAPSKTQAQPRPRKKGPAPPVEARETTRESDREPSRESAREREEPSPVETEEEETAEKTLEEVEEMHLRDSFWTVP